MDFLGLKNLSIIKDCIKIIQELHGVNIDIDAISLEDPKHMKFFNEEIQLVYSSFLRMV